MEDEHIVLKRKIKFEEMLQIIEVPFIMPKDMEKVSVKYKFEESDKGNTIIDLGIKDSCKVRGWSGGARREFYIGIDRATPGYLPGNLCPGRWAVLLGAYKVPSNGTEVTISIELIKRSSKWLKGDMHMHSVHSDGSFSLEQIIEISEKVGLDFIALTDHNTTSQNYVYPRDTKVLVIPGMELTTYKGHMNFLGILDPVDDFRVMSKKDIYEKISEAKDRGAKITLNHPHENPCKWRWQWDIDYDWVEVWNGPWTSGNDGALKWWQSELASGRKLVAIGGSDTHRPNPYVKHGFPTSWVYAETKTKEAIFIAIDKGRVFITYCPDGPIIDFKSGKFMLGDTVSLDDNTNFKLSLKNIIKGDKVKIVTEKGVNKEILMDSNDNEYEVIWKAEKHLFYRIEVWRYFNEVNDYLMAAMCNPIFLEY